jgi:heme-degrading monooxygenase HmoA
MIEVTLSYGILPNIDQKAYGEWAKKTLGVILQSPGLVEFRANRNLLGDPQVRSTTVWKSLADWANYTDSDEWRALEEEARGFVSNLQVEIWGPSPIVPEPLRPS